VKKLLAALSLALLFPLALGVNGASATHSPGTDPQHDFVSGTGLFQLEGGPLVLFHLNAKSGPAGEDPQGHASVRQPGGEFSFMGEVTCLNVIGNTAVAGGVITQSDFGPGAEGNGFLIWVIDNGQGVKDAAVAQLLPEPPPACPAPGLGIPFKGGNFIVHDATP
jgi:hypothetical protein